MKNVLFLLSAVALISCSPDRAVVAVIDGAPGHDGVGQSCFITPIEGGYNLACGDNVAFVASGSPGLPGEPGVPGLPGMPGTDGTKVTVYEYSEADCLQVIGSTSYLVISNNNKYLYSSDTCANNTKFATISQGESYWASDTALVVYSSGGVRVIVFGEVN